jgi:kumamolisin
MARTKPPGFVALRGTKLPPLPGVKTRRAPRSNRRHTLTVHLRSRAPEKDALEEVVAGIYSGARPPLTRSEFIARFGAAPADIALVRRFAREHGFLVSSVNRARRMLHLTGGASALAKAFNVKRVRRGIGTTEWESYDGQIWLPVALAGVVDGVYGFDSRPALERGNEADSSAPPADIAKSYSPTDVADLYGFPPCDGRGQSVGVIALGGGYRQSDLRHFFRSMRLPMPEYRSISVSGARNAPSGALRAYDGEVTGDIQTVGAVVPRARIGVYFAPNTARGFLEAIGTAIHDPIQAITVLSISWGQGEVHFRRRTIHNINRLLLEAAALGVTVCCSSGDHGSFADTFDRKPHVCFPGSSPWALACGGTSLVGARGRIISESVWHNATGASGGGVSEIFARPEWQQRSRVPSASSGFLGRGVPDVASHADPLRGYRIFVNGHWAVGAGTSASSPMWAGLIARLNQGRRQPIGLITPHLYKHFVQLRRHKAVAPITKGSNGMYRARKGWSCCTGLGSPRGARLGAALAKHVKGFQPA